MKRTSRFFLAVVLGATGPALCAGTIDHSYEVATWQGFRSAAITYTFDDGYPSQLRVAVPMFDEFGFKLTLFTITGQSPNWSALQQAADHGHEIASHTVTHPVLNTLSVDEQTKELRDSQADINAHIVGHPCLTLAYPYGIPPDPGLCAQYYIAARGCQGVVESSTPADLMNISSLICGPEGTVQTVADFNDSCATAADLKGWCVFLIHGLDEGNYSPFPSDTLWAGLQYVDARRSTFWVETFGNVARYIRERDAVSVTEQSHDATHITVLVSDKLDDTIYNVPLTLRRPLPAGWPSARVVQNGRVMPVAATTLGSGKAVMFDVLPTGKEIVLTKAPVPPAGLTATAAHAAIKLHWNDGNDTSVVGYHVYRSVVSGDRYVRLNPSLLTDRNYVDADAAPDKTYYYVVTSVDDHSRESGYSNEASARSLPTAH